MLKIHPLPMPSKFRDGHSDVVSIFDRIRFDFEDDHSLFEFCWFAREYPRCYRHHLKHAEIRLRDIYEKFQHFQVLFETELAKSDEDTFIESAIFNEFTDRIYWDFEAFLAAISSALDVLARLVGPAFIDPAPKTFNKLTKADIGGISEILKKAKLRWAGKMKDYRNCFVHHTPVDTRTLISVVRYSDGCEVRGKIPINPRSQDITRFRFRRRTELLRYAISTHRRMYQLDESVGKEIAKLYAIGKFPLRTTRLFFLGRERASS